MLPQQRSFGRCWGSDGNQTTRAARKICAALALEGELWNYFTVLLFFYSYSTVRSITSEISQSRMSQRESRVFVVIGLPCFILCNAGGKALFKNQMIFRDVFTQECTVKWRISNHNYHLDSKSITRDLLIILIISSIIVIMREGFPFLIIPQKGRLLHTGALCFGVGSFPVFLFFTWRDES